MSRLLYKLAALARHAIILHSPLESDLSLLHGVSSLTNKVNNSGEYGDDRFKDEKSKEGVGK
jgi:hypothetical protein